MALKAGSLLTTGNDSVLIERLQTGGPGTLNIPTEKIYELGNYESVATIRDVPDLTFSLESLDVTTDTEAMLADVSADTDGIDLATVRPLNVATQIKPGKKQLNPFDIVRSVAIPYLSLESASYKFGLRENARQTFSLRGDSIFYNPGATYIDEAVGTGIAGQAIITTHSAYPFTDGNGTRRVLAVVAGIKRLSFGPDYALSYGIVTADAAIVTVTLTDAVPVTDTIRVVYASPALRTYPQSVHTLATLKPAAVRGKDIDVYIGGYDPADVAGSQAHKWTGVQDASVDWKVTLEKEEEFGNYYAVGQDFDVPTVSGAITIQPRDPADLWKKLREITGLESVTAVIGANVAVPLPLDIIIKDGQNGGVTLKRFHIPDARFSVPGYNPRIQQNVTMSLEWESDTGAMTIYRDLSAPVVAAVAPSTGVVTDIVSISGINFVGVTAVTFGGVAATTFTVDNHRHITATVPAHAVGPVDVLVTTPKGTNAVGGQEFTYTA